MEVGDLALDARATHNHVEPPESSDGLGDGKIAVRHAPYIGLHEVKLSGLNDCVSLELLTENVSTAGGNNVGSPTREAEGCCPPYA